MLASSAAPAKRAAPKWSGKQPHPPTVSWPIAGSFKKRYTCSLCSYSTDYPTNIQRHMLTHTGERPFRCTTCGKGFTTKQNLESHALQHVKNSWCPL